jgi:hypothetical membrane protein
MDQRMVIRALLACGAIGPSSFVLVLLIEGATRPGYNMGHHAGSLLGLGERGWTQNANFVVCGLLLLCFAIALNHVRWSGERSIWGPLLIAGSGVGLIVSGIFVADPAFGYPPGMSSSPTLDGLIHNIASVVVFGCLSAACFVLARSVGKPAYRGWRLYSIITGIVGAVFFLAAIVTSTLLRTGPSHAPQ